MHWFWKCKKNDSRILGVKIKHVRMPPYTRVPSLKKVQKGGGVMSFWRTTKNVLHSLNIFFVQMFWELQIPPPPRTINGWVIGCACMCICWSLDMCNFTEVCADVQVSMFYCTDPLVCMCLSASVDVLLCGSASVHVLICRCAKVYNVHVLIRGWLPLGCICQCALMRPCVLHLHRSARHCSRYILNIVPYWE